MQQTPPPEEPVVMGPPWWALPVTAVGCLVFVAMGAALVAAGDAPGTAIGIVSVAFFGGGLVALVLRRPLALGDRDPRPRRDPAAAGPRHARSLGQHRGHPLQEGRSSGRRG